MDELSFTKEGLIPVIVQESLTGEIRMFAWMNREALRATLDTGKATFFSRSRNRIWVKGETSGNTLEVESVYADCDQDVLLVLARPAGPSCHTGRPTCFFRRLAPSGQLQDEPWEAGAFLGQLEHEIEQREISTAERSYTKSLLDAGATKIGAKLREEAGELSEALQHESDERVASEAADVVYHLLVGLRSRRLTWRHVIEVLAARSGVSGHTEKAQRGSS